MLRCFHNSKILLKANPSLNLRYLSTASDKKLIVFDKDGTLLSFHKPWLLWCNRVKHRLGDCAKDAVSRSVDNKLKEMGVVLSKGEIKLGSFAESSQVTVRNEISEAFNRALQETSEQYYMKSEEVFRDAQNKDDVKDAALADVSELLRTLRNAGYKIAIATADTEAGVKDFLHNNNASHLVDFIMCSCSTEMPAKPSPVSAEMICQRMEVRPENSIMVGDTPTDMEFGVNGKYGEVIGVTSGIGDEATLRRSGATAILSSVNCLHRHLGVPATNGIRGVRHHSTSTARPNYAAESKHDYVIVGAGSAGCVLANRLSEDDSSSVLSLEAGPKDTILGSRLLLWTIHMPSALMYNLCHDKYNWYYHTTPQKNMDNRVMYWPRGRVWGGSSALNAMVYIRGNALDYDRWEREGAINWSYAHCLPYFKRSTRHSLGEDDYRGGHGPVGVTRHSMDNPLYHAFIEAGQQAGYPYTDDLNGFQQEGVGPMDSTTWKGMRSSAAVGYLHDSVSLRKNLSAETGCLVTRVIIKGGKAVGVEYRQNNELKYAAAEKSVILSGGAINTPQLLMLSGVGPANHLHDHNISVNSDLPGVGENLQDHLEVYVQQECKKPITLYKWQQPHNMIGIGLQWFFNQSGICSSAHLEAGGFIRSRRGIEHPDIQFHFLPSQVVDHGRGKIEYEAYQLHVGPMRQASRGFLRLQSNDPSQHPIIEPNYLSTDIDIWEMRQCIKLSREIFAQPAFDEFRARELRPGEDADTDDKIDAFVRKYGDSAYHPSCTCKMGTDDMSVVNPKTMEVYGVEKLRVVDASVMPSVVSGNLNGPTLMVAEKSADIILGRVPLTPAFDVPVYKPTTLDTQR